MSNFTKGSIELLTVCVETCKYMEQEDHTYDEFMDKIQKLLPYLYMKAAMAEKPKAMVYDSEPEKFVTEVDYTIMLKSMAALFGKEDVYLTVMHKDMTYSDTPISAKISEDLADIYQSIKDFAKVGALGNEDLLNDGLMVLLDDFYAYWGQKLLNTMGAIHSILMHKYEAKS